MVLLKPSALLKIFTCVVFVSHIFSCKEPPPLKVPLSYKEDSAKVRALLWKGNDLYAQRSSMNAIGESMLYYDSAYGLAQRIGDTALLAHTLLSIGNVYNAWNGEPQKTIDYYSCSAVLFSKLKGNEVNEYYLRYIIAHGYDSEKGNDSTRCIQTIAAALHDLQQVPAHTKDSMDYLPDFAWVATNVKNYALAETILNGLAMHPKNNSATNNYLDHYYITRARIDIYGYHKKSPYTDSLEVALRHCNNRFDSGYYAYNLSALYDATGDYKNAFRFSRLSNDIQNRLGKTDILTALRTQLLNKALEEEREKEKGNREALKLKNLYLYAAGLVLIIILLLGFLYSLLQKRKYAQQQVIQQEAFTKQLLQKEEDERKRIAMELHDGINHELLTVKNNIILHKPVMVADVENIITSVRDMSRNLYPALFESVGLQASVEALCRNITEAGFFTTCDIEYSKMLNREDELQLYRIIQEAIHNMAKHAGAEACKITIRSDAHKLFAEIKDNGHGFEHVRADINSFGLQSMKQRAKAFGAKLQIESSKLGTTINLTKKLS